MFNFDEMFENIEKIQPSPKKFGPDPRFWKLSRNDDDVGLARIRLLPSKIIQDGEEKTVPYVRVYKYAINLRSFGAKKFTDIESPETIGKPCAIADLRKELYKIGNEEAKKVLEILKRSERYISNIYVVNDPIKPENTGQVKLWEYGVKLKDKFMGWLNPSAEDIALGAKPINVWHPLNGADIKLVMRKSGGFYNYDDTSHYDPAPLAGGDKEKIKEILSKTIPLTEWLEESHYLSYEEEVEKLLWLFDGTKVEDILKSLGVSLYKGVKADNTAVNPQVLTENKATGTKTTENKATETTTTENKEFGMEMNTSSSSQDDDLDFLDDL
jgi:hypothetical protein